MVNSIKNILLTLFLACAVCACSPSSAESAHPHETLATQTVTLSNTDIEQAFAAKKSGVQVSGHGEVIKLLADDNKGARHQKFLVRINAQQVLLFAHNTDLAPKVPLQVGDSITFHGEYVYNPKGGVMHWTHHAPHGDHVAGWIMLDGRKYQ